MACDHRNVKKQPSFSPMSPRISFSHDFVESSSSNNNHSRHDQNLKLREASPASSDFEFSPSNHPMMTADELFFKGRFLPFRNHPQKPATLREKLLVEEDEEGVDGGCSRKPPQQPPLKGSSSSNRWKEIWGLRKNHHGSKKSGSDS